MTKPSPIRALCTLSVSFVALLACNRATPPAPAAHDIADLISYRVGPHTQSHLRDGAIACEACTARYVELAGGPAIEVRTVSEFSDLLLDASLFSPDVPEGAGGGPGLDLRDYPYVQLDLLLPDDSKIAAVKLNFRNAAGDFGGVSEVANDFLGRRGEWLHVEADFASLASRFKHWHGEGDVLSRVGWVSINPYSIEQADSTSYFIRGVSFSRKQRPSYEARLQARPDSVRNDSYRITFDDTAWLARMTGYRLFEATTQTIRAGVAGNPSNSIRLRGKEEYRHLAFLPEVANMTGHPVDFTQVDSLTFRYYLTPESAPFDGATLYLVSEDWADILLDSAAVSTFVPGAWRTARIAIGDLDLERVRGELSAQQILSAVHQLRLDLNYRPRRKDIELWIDDFGWE